MNPTVPQTRIGANDFCMSKLFIWLFTVALLSVGVVFVLIQLGLKLIEFYPKISNTRDYEIFFTDSLAFALPPTDYFGQYGRSVGGNGDLKCQSIN